MHQARVGVVPAFLGYRVGPALHLEQRHAGADEAQVVFDLVHRQPVDLFLPSRRLRRAAVQRARQVDEIAERPDHVGVEADEVAGLDAAVARFLQPRIDPRARREHAPLVPVAVVGDIGVVQQSPQLQLGHAGSQRAFEHPRAVLADGDRPAHAGDFVVGFDHARQLGDAHAVDDLDSARLERLRDRRVDVLDGDPAVVAADLGQVVDDILRQLARGHVDVGAAVEKSVRPPRAKIVHLRHVVVTAVEDDRPFLRHEQIHLRNVRLEQRVAAVVDRVAQADRVDQDHEGRVVRAQLLLDSRDAIGRHPLEVDRRHFLQSPQVAPVVVEDEAIDGIRAHRVNAGRTTGTRRSRARCRRRRYRGG